MNKWRLAIVLVLLAAPALFLMAAGTWWLWRENWWWLAWWPLAACLALAYFLAWRWQRQARLLPDPGGAQPLHWTARDQAAWELVEARAKAVPSIAPNRLMEFQFYVDTAQAMAFELARYYHPRAQDPVGSLTIPEILTVVELAAHDLAEMVDDYLPGGHLLTVDDWRRTSQVAEWYNWGRNIYWAVSALFSPVNTALRFAASTLGMSRPLQALQENLLAWFYTAFLHRVGTYLIELNSGRLRVGAKRYRELLEQGQPPEEVEPSEEAAAPREVSIVLIGRVKAGKSSLINALLGERRAVTDVLPMTNEITRYALDPKAIPGRLVFWDTVGYAHAGPKADQLKATEEALQKSDLALLVLHARDPARQPDVELLQTLRAWFAARPHLKMPPVLGVLTHIDLLSPLMEWAPPYDWVEPRRPKEHSIHDAVAAAQEQLGNDVVGMVPVCVAEGKVYGVQEWLLPCIVERLGEARAVALLRCLQAEADSGKIRKVFYQLLRAGKQLLRVTFQAPSLERPSPERQRGG
jgi:predicted GTPase